MLCELQNVKLTLGTYPFGTELGTSKCRIMVELEIDDVAALKVPPALSRSSRLFEM